MTDSLKTDLLCPVCGAALACDPEGRRFFCDAGHSYDRARAGYVHLLLPNRAGSDTPGDDREMVRARSTFLESGAYAPLSDAVNSLCMAFARSGEYTAPLLLADAGCGEGYYTNRLAAALQSCGVDARVYGFDVSKHACAHGCIFVCHTHGCTKLRCVGEYFCALCAGRVSSCAAAWRATLHGSTCCRSFAAIEKDIV